MGRSIYTPVELRLGKYQRKGCYPLTYEFPRSDVMTTCSIIISGPGVSEWNAEETLGTVLRASQYLGVIGQAKKNSLRNVAQCQKMFVALPPLRDTPQFVRIVELRSPNRTP